MTSDTREPAGSPAARIVVCPDGPLLVRGEFAITDADGRPMPRRRAVVALCRCGATGIAPYCDGSHKVVGFSSSEQP